MQHYNGRANIGRQEYATKNNQSAFQVIFPHLSTMPTVLQVELKMAILRMNNNLKFGRSKHPSRAMVTLAWILAEFSRRLKFAGAAQNIVVASSKM